MGVPGSRGAGIPARPWRRALVLLALLLATGSQRGPAGTAFPPGRAVAGSPLGVYTGSAQDGAAGHESFARWAGVPVPYALDYAAAAGGWSAMVQPGHLLDAWQGRRVHLVYSLQMFPAPLARSLGGGAALGRCAAGEYDPRWRTLARTLVRHHRSDAIVRPGWEMNNTWFPWSAVGRPRSYIGCFRHIVTAMRGVPGGAFTFTWNPSIGAGAMPAERAWPGDAYVDQVGVDVFNWAGGGAVPGDPRQRAFQARSRWETKLAGNHGLRFWATFAAAHGATLSLPEWGLARRPGEAPGSGDDPEFVRGILDFVLNRGNHVAYACYFDTISPDADHRLTGAPPPFPLAAAAFVQVVRHHPGSRADPGPSPR